MSFVPLSKKQSPILPLGISLFVSIFLLVLIGRWTQSIHIDTPEIITSQTQSYDQGGIGEFVPMTGFLFSTPDDDSVSLWIGNIGQPKFLSGRLYQFTSRDIIAYWQTLRNNGTKISLILEQNKYKQSNRDAHDLIQKLSGNTVSIIPDTQLGVNFTHAKTFFTEQTGIIQTANLTHSSMTKNLEHFVVITDTGVLNSLRAMHTFDRMGKQRTMRPPAIHPNLLICPFDCGQKYLHLINTAKKSIITMQQYISDEGILAALDSARQRGVDVRIILADLPANVAQAKSSDNIFVPKKPYIHSKTILADGKYLIVGSMNMSANSLYKNREIGVVITDTVSLQHYTDQFAKIWAMRKNEE